MAHFPKPFFKKARQLWYVEIDRKQHCLGPDKEVAFVQYHQLMQVRQRTPLGLAAAGVRSPLVAVLADAYFEWVKANRSAATYTWYRQMLQRFCAKHPTLNVADLKPFHVQQWVDESKHLSKSTRRNLIRSVKACIRWSLNQGYIEKNPLMGLPLPPSEYREVTIPLADYHRLLAAITDAGFRDLVVLTWETGCRPQESVRIEARHVDIERQRIVFPKAEAKGKRQPRIIYLTEVALEIISRRCVQYPAGPIMRQTNGVSWKPSKVSRKFGQLQCRMGKALFLFDHVVVQVFHLGTVELMDQMILDEHRHASGDEERPKPLICKGEEDSNQHDDDGVSPCLPILLVDCRFLPESNGPPVVIRVLALPRSYPVLNNDSMAKASHHITKHRVADESGVFRLHETHMERYQE